MKKLILALFLFLFIVTSSRKYPLIGTWQSANGSVLSISQSHIMSDGEKYPFRYLSNNTLLVFKNGKPHKTSFIISFDKNQLTVNGIEFHRYKF